jgi:hypothetical protein
MLLFAINFFYYFSYIFQKIYRFNNFEIIIVGEIIKLQKYLNVLNDNNVW